MPAIGGAHGELVGGDAVVERAQRRIEREDLRRRADGDLVGDRPVDLGAGAEAAERAERLVGEELRPQVGQAQVDARAGLRARDEAFDRIGEGVVGEGEQTPVVAYRRAIEPVDRLQLPAGLVDAAAGAVAEPRLRLEQRLVLARELSRGAAHAQVLGIEADQLGHQPIGLGEAIVGDQRVDQGELRGAIVGREAGGDLRLGLRLALPAARVGDLRGGEADVGIGRRGIREDRDAVPRARELAGVEARLGVGDLGHGAVRIGIARRIVGIDPPHRLVAQQDVDRRIGGGEVLHLDRGVELSVARLHVARLARQHAVVAGERLLRTVQVEQRVGVGLLDIGRQRIGPFVGGSDRLDLLHDLFHAKAVAQRDDAIVAQPAADVRIGRGLQQRVEPGDRRVGLIEAAGRIARLDVLAPAHQRRGLGGLDRRIAAAKALGRSRRAELGQHCGGLAHRLAVAGRDARGGAVSLERREEIASAAIGIALREQPLDRHAAVRARAAL